ncbi:MAG TPA: hypothetical protein IAB38_02610 [Candidatus Onthousia excrementipullorum]|uniref:SGNH hydrolase-type esterase domain-containing protein n=1 Tax=Candidatus Onthousia excrementipullorum TaxID=2840884 RepID=A0A9D1DTP3_9FIRM|nr:hypothetical protein [Candidatus Onthousia excrementipullorum]
MRDINILVFGDSITYGAWDKEKGGWVNRLRLALENDDSNSYYTIFNLGISGDVTESIKNRFDNECKIRFNKNDNTIIIFSIGINDTQNVKDEDRVSLETFRNNIITLINSAKKYTDNILFIGLTKVDESKVTPLPWDKEKGYLNTKIINFDKELKNICLENNVDYLYIYELLEIEELFDGLHPNNVGHQKICDKVKTKISKYY